MSEAISRRGFLKAVVTGGAAVAAGGRLGLAAITPSTRRPNVVLIITDQHHLNALSAHGCADVHTPNLDGLVRGGFTFMQSHSTDPVCSPARSSLFTGRMPSETGVVANELAIRAGMPNLGEWLRQEGYQTVYAGKWHVPHSYPAQVPGFLTLRTGIGGQGNIGDAAVSRACQGYLRQRSGTDPFFLVASFLQPHDICQFVSMHRNTPDTLPYPEIARRL
ncbi:MAG: sulfatase-like hydrolase/transferase, partial [Armatimonadota bacterium]|nr:sulfatase-like hydrolase/transferase [Armatimonadota bacterium]